MTINIVLAGPRGRMGTAAIKMITHEEKFNIEACIDRKNDGKTLNEINQVCDEAIPIFENATTCFKEIKPDVFIDLTIPDVGFKHTKLALTQQVCSVVGTSGLSDEQIGELAIIAERNQTGCIIAPNFALGAVLLMLFSKMAAKYFPDVEIIEKHHDQKIDAPSGTA